MVDGFSFSPCNCRWDLLHSTPIGFFPLVVWPVMSMKGALNVRTLRDLAARMESIGF